jgi:putative nucleotidyltransferase with HDIG domain
MNCAELKAATASLMAALRMRDKDTHDHSERVARVAVLLGQRMRLSAEQRSHLYYGSLLHDIGKISIRDSVLKKDGPHTPSECSHMREHVVTGTEMLSALDFPSEVVACVQEHHERVDGQGYPFGLKGAEICLPARICAVADAFDAITNNRCYRAGRSYQAAAHALKQGSGSQFDQNIVETFLVIGAEELRRMAWVSK